MEPGLQNPAAGMVSVFGSASYRLNDHILVYGTGVKHFGNPPLMMPFNPYYRDSFTVGSELKLGEHFTFGASVRMGQQPYNYLNPYNAFGPYTPGPFNPVNMNLLLLSLAPVFIILIYVYFRDKYEKEPLGLLIKALVAGAIIVLPVSANGIFFNRDDAWLWIPLAAWL